MQLLLENGNEHLRRHGAPDPRLDRVLAGARELFDAQVRIDPLEKQLNLPAVLIQGRNGQSGQARVVGQKYQHFG